MGSNPVVFQNLLGQPVVEPSVSSLWTIDIASLSRFVAQHDVVLLSWFEGGPPGILAPYLDAQEIISTYDPENVHTLGTELVPYLKTPSFDANVRGAYRIYVLRLGNPTQGSLILQSSVPATVLTYTSRDYGTYVNKISLEVASGSLTGKRITRRFRDQPLVVDNLGSAFQIAYTGNGTAATLTITRTGDRATRLQTALTGATDGSINLDLDLTGGAFDTQQQLVTYINGQNGYRCRVDPYSFPLLPTYELDGVSAANIRTATALTIQYTGGGSAATMTTSGTALTTLVTGGVGSENLTIDLTAAGTDTLGELVAYIDALAGYTCTLGPNADRNAACLNLFTVVSTQNIRTTPYALTTLPGAMNYVSTAQLGSIVFAINSLDERGSLTRTIGATAPPANLAQTFLTGGTNPTPTISDWLEGLEVVNQEDLEAGGIVFPVSTDPVVQESVMAWMLEQHSVHGRSFRGFFGTPDWITPADAKTWAMGFNSTYATLAVQAVIAASGVTELPPIYAAAMMCGGAAGAITTQPITDMVLRARGLPARAKWSKAQREDLEANGVCVIKEDKGRGVVIGLAVTTSLSDNRPDRMLSESMARDVIEQRVRAYVKPLLPRWAYLEFMADVKAVVINALSSLEREHVITQGRDSQNRILRAYLPPQVSIQGGLLRVTVSVKIGGEIDHIDVLGTIAYQTFEMTMTAGT